MPPFPPLSPAERLLSWVGLISWSKPDILENVCSGAEQAGIFISRLHLHCFLSWRGAGGGGSMRCGFILPAREAPKRTLLSSFSSLSSSCSLGWMEAGASKTFQRSAQLENAISNYPPISLACKMCFCVGCLFGKVPVLWVALCCSFRRPRNRTGRCLDPSLRKFKCFPQSHLGTNKYTGPRFLSFVHLLTCLPIIYFQSS